MTIPFYSRYIIILLIPVAINDAVHFTSNTCYAKMKLYYPQFLDPFWFVPELFKQTSILNRCTVDYSTGDKLYINCDWSEADADLFKGEAYKYVEEACQRKGGLIHLAYTLNTTLTYGANATIESSVHHNVPLCLAPGCDVNDVANKFYPCSQYNLFNLNITENEWVYNNTEENVANGNCMHEINVASTFLDEQCLNKWTYTYLDEIDNCSDGNVCDFSNYTEPWGEDYDPSFCDAVDAKLYAFSFSIYGEFYDTGIVSTKNHYILNHPTCLLKSCDVVNYFTGNLLPYYTRDVYNLSETGKMRNYEYKILRTTPIGLKPVSDNEEDYENFFCSGEEWQSDTKRSYRVSSKKAKKSPKSNKVHVREDDYYDYTKESTRTESKYSLVVDQETGTRKYVKKKVKVSGGKKLGI